MKFIDSVSLKMRIRKLADVPGRSPKIFLLSAQASLFADLSVLN